MFELDKSKSFKELASGINRDALPKVLVVGLDRLLVTEGIDRVTGSDEETISLFSKIETYYPLALGIEPPAPTEAETLQQSTDAVEVLKLAIEFEEDEVQIAEINEAIELLELALSLDL